MELAALDSRLSRAEQEAISSLPQRLQAAAHRVFASNSVEEIRLRVNKPVQLITSRDEIVLNAFDVLSEREARQMLENICRHSVYAWENELCSGYLTLPGGVRVGISGKPLVDNGRIIRFTCVTGFNIRIAREVIGCSDGVIKYLFEGGRPVSTLIAAPPSGGKTTLLRDIARRISQGGCGARPMKVAIADERNEIAGCMNGIPSLDVGLRTDVMDGVPKRLSIFMMIRSMSPDVIITDEIGGSEDMLAVGEAAKCGVAVIASIHAGSSEELRRKRWLAEALRDGVFGKVLLLHRYGSRLAVAPVEIKQYV